MAWAPTKRQTIEVTTTERELFGSRNASSAFLNHCFRTLKGIHKGGEFPVAVVRKVLEDRGYQWFVSAQSKHGIPCYLLERLPGVRRKGDAAYLRMVEAFGREALDRLHVMAAASRAAVGLTAAGGDPDLFVQGGKADRFFVEVKLEDLTGRRAYRDTIGRQQHVLFPLIESELGCPVELVTVSVVAD